MMHAEYPAIQLQDACIDQIILFSVRHVHSFCNRPVFRAQERLIGVGDPIQHTLSSLIRNANVLLLVVVGCAVAPPVTPRIQTSVP